MNSAVASLALKGAVGESSGQGPMRMVCLSVLSCQLAWPSQVREVGIGGSGKEPGIRSRKGRSRFRIARSDMRQQRWGVLVGLYVFDDNKVWFGRSQSAPDFPIHVVSP